MSRYLIDTNILSEPLKPQPNPRVMERWQEHNDEIAIASVTWHEICYGCWRLPVSRRREQIEAYLQEVQAAFPILPYDLAAAAWHAEERARLTTLGQIPAFADGQITSVAYANNLILVTNNLADFVNFRGVQIENWFE